MRSLSGLFDALRSRGRGCVLTWVSYWVCWFSLASHCQPKQSGACVQSREQPWSRCLLRVMGRTVRKDGSAQGLRPIHIEEQITITGGCCGKKMVLDIEVLTWEGEQLTSVVIGKQESWLCQLVCGNGVWHRPLQRCNIFRDLTTTLAEPEAVSADDKMSLLNLDDEELLTVTPTKKTRRLKPSAVKTPVVTGGMSAETITRIVQMPQLPESATKISVYVAQHKKKMWLACRSLPWLVAYLHNEKESGGVPSIPTSEVAESQHLIKWDFRDDLWVARVKSPSGRLYRRRSGYRRRQKMKAISAMDCAIARPSRRFTRSSRNGSRLFTVVVLRRLTSST